MSLKIRTITAWSRLHIVGELITVSGDKHLLELKEFKGIRIVTVSEMLDILEKGVDENG